MYRCQMNILYFCLKIFNVFFIVVYNKTVLIFKSVVHVFCRSLACAGHVTLIYLTKYKNVLEITIRRTLILTLT
jgi:hypothetical protein